MWRNRWSKGGSSSSRSSSKEGRGKGRSKQQQQLMDAGAALSAGTAAAGNVSEMEQDGARAAVNTTGA